MRIFTTQNTTDNNMIDILLLGNMPEQQQALAGALADAGCRVTVAACGLQAGKPADTRYRLVRLSMNRARLALQVAGMLSELGGHDIVQLFGTAFLPPLGSNGQLRLFRHIRKHNPLVFLSVESPDYYYVRSCYEGNGFAYNHYFVGNTLSPYAQADKRHMHYWLAAPQKALTTEMARSVEAIMTGRLEVYAAYAPLFPRRTFYVDTAVDLSRPPLPAIGKGEKVRIALIRPVPKQPDAWGTEMLDATARSVCSARPGEAEFIGTVSSDDNYGGAHIILDSVYSYSPSPEALRAMACGRVAVTGGEPEYYDFVNAGQLRPIVNVSPDPKSIRSALHALLDNRPALATRMRDSRLFVETMNAGKTAAQACMGIWGKFRAQPAPPYIKS